MEGSIMANERSAAVAELLRTESPSLTLRALDHAVWEAGRSLG